MISAFLKFRKQNRKKLRSHGYIKKLHSHSYIDHEEVNFFLCISLFFKKFIFVEVTLIYNITYVSHVQCYISTLYTLQLLSNIYCLSISTQLTSFPFYPHLSFPSVVMFIFVWFVHLLWSLFLCFLYCTNEWNYMLFVFNHLSYFT